jgi:type II secretory pathway component PulF
MPNFRYQALDTNRQIVTGELEAESVHQAIAELDAAGLAVQSIALAFAESRAEFTDGTRGAGRRLEENTRQNLLRPHVERVLAAGPALAPALEAYADEVPWGYRRRELQSLADVLRRGDAVAAERAFTALPEYWIPLLSAATTGRARPGAARLPGGMAAYGRTAPAVVGRAGLPARDIMLGRGRDDRDQHVDHPGVSRDVRRF